MKLFLSNRLEVLADALRDDIFSKKNPFEIHYVVVPSSQVKNFLVGRWVKDDTIQVVAGIKILTIAEALPLFFPQIPTPIELSFQIEQLLSEKQIDGPVKVYLETGGDKRLGSLADSLSSIFLEYGISDKESLAVWKQNQGWQQDLWKKLFPYQTPWEMSKSENCSFYMFHLSFLPLFYFRFFETKNVQVYQLSPSEMFWGDFFSDKTQAFLLKKLGSLEKVEWKEFVKEQNSLLANNGRIYQRFFQMVQDLEIPYEELYEEPSGESSLAKLQKEILFLENLQKKCDLSLQIHSAPSKLREVEAVWEIIQGLNVLPDQIAVYAPDIMEYLPYIHMVFGREETPFEYSIFDLEFSQSSLLAEGLKHFLTIASFRFNKESILKLLSFSNFLDKWKLSSENVETLNQWMQDAYVHNFENSSWEISLKRLLEALASISGGFSISLMQADLLGKWITIIESIQTVFTPILQGEKKRVSDWMIYLQNIIELFFSTSEDDVVLLKELDRLGKINAGPFSFSTIERVLEKIFTKRENSFQGGYQGSVKFSSLKPGNSSLFQSVILMGMEDGLFPRTHLKTSLEEISSKESPTLTEEDRYVFLEQLLCARSHFILTYTRIDKQDGKENPPSLLIQELMRSFPQIYIKHHPKEPFDKSCFQEGSYSSFYWSAAQKFYEKKLKNLPILSLPPSLSFKQDVTVLDIRDLKKLARHPIQFYLEKKHGIYFQKEETTHQEFVLSNLELSLLRQASLKEDVSSLIQKAEAKGILPASEFKEVAIYKIKEEVEAYHEALNQLGVDKNNIFSIEFNSSCRKAVQIRADKWVFPALKLICGGKEMILTGQLEDLTPQGILVHGKETLEDLIKAWPLYLIVKQVPLNIEPYFLLTKEGKKTSSPFLEEENALLNYFKYALIARETPSPFLPRFASYLLQENSENLQKAFRADEQGNFSDPILDWLREREGFPPIQNWHQLWAPFFKEIFKPREGC